MMDSEFLRAWAEFNRIKWNCRVLSARFEASSSDAYAESMFFLNDQGKLYLPPLNPYHPTLFKPTPTSRNYRIERQWHEAADALCSELLKVGGYASFCLPPEFTDIRPFLWRGFKVDVKYTYYIDLPCTPEMISQSARGRLKKAVKAGYRAARTYNMQEVHACLAGTEQRKGFSHQLQTADLELARSLLGDDTFRCYACYSPEGEAVSANISILLGGSRALGWIASSKSEHLSSGAAQLLQYAELEDLHLSGITSFDFGGANLASVSEAKAQWGGRLVPYYVIKNPGLKEVLRSGWDWLQFNSGKGQK
ncbi:hypothetical protein DCC85_21100 [Paenibacillus sp. CAA11]|uniref:GNAT family N-acetyltransferase n=1 Tax=Paenibacillus sp. CAA11 TaxID=1532905 RepID=UPI000D39EE7C|nr:GNAT family N-acetyltransferase [Paenibacillus sp. CAA11]AWB46417.1 hypothetical protein DCC85_21100 [Paenibacillus sp. CAA11]